MSGDFSLIWAVLGLPILGFLIQAFLGKKLAETAGTRLVGALAVLPILIAFGIAAKLTMDLSSLEPAARNVIVTGPAWIDVAGLKMPFEWLIDPLSMTMVLIITGVGGLIHLYATGYMAKEREYARFFTYLNLFIAAMLILVLGNNLGLLFMGWEGVGLCSYLLIGFWYKDHANARAANKAFIVNRIGDWGLSIGMFLIFALLVSQHAPGVIHVPRTATVAIDGTRYLSYDVMLPALKQLLELNPILATAIALLLFIGAAGKSAQFPLYMWLPDAMAGPTPVSALIHAATMVTSGVVLLNRMHVVFEASAVAGAVIVVIGAFTALFAAIIAFGQTDIKKVLAFSTVSQLGFMFVGCGAGAYWTGMFHVTTHAFFKALLFLGAGAVIHAMAHNQDMRNYGNLRKYLPVTTFTMVIGWLAIAAVAIPVGQQVFAFAGAYSKEAILSSALGGDYAVINGVSISVFAGWVSLFTALLTAIYMTRLMMLTFFGKEERWRLIPAHANHGHEVHVTGHEEPLENENLPETFYLAEATRYEEEEHHELDENHTPREVPFSMWFPLVVLALLSAGGGYLMAKGDVFETWLASGPLLATPPEFNEVPNLALYSAVAAAAGVLLGWFFYRKGLPKAQGWDEAVWQPWRRSARDQFGYDNALTQNAVEGGGDLARGIWKYFDSGVVDGLVNGSAAGASWLGGLLKRAQTGYVRLYALVMLFGGVAFLGYFIFAMHQLGGAK